MISFCTACTGRVHHIKMTYKSNLKIAPEHEFVLINYGIDKELDDYVKNDLLEFIKNEFRNKVKFNYYQTDAKYFHMAKSKNLTHRLATGDFLFCLDADTYIGPRAVEKSIKCLEGDYYLGPHWSKDIYGLSKDIEIYQIEQGK